RGQGRRLGQRPGQQPVRGGPPPVVRHGVAAHLEVTRDAARPLAQLQPSQDLSNLGHRTPPSRQSSSLREEDDVSEAVNADRGFNTKESGHRPLGGSACPPLGGSAWATLPGSGWVTRVAHLARSRWLTIGRPLTSAIVVPRAPSPCTRPMRTPPTVSTLRRPNRRTRAGGSLFPATASSGATSSRSRGMS